MWVTLTKADQDTWTASNHERDLKAQGPSIEEALRQLKAVVKASIEEAYSKGNEPVFLQEAAQNTLTLMDDIMQRGHRIPFKQAVEANESPLLTYVPITMHSKKVCFKPAWFAWTLSQALHPVSG